jgi:hypothetical protein
MPRRLTQFLIAAAVFALAIGGFVSPAGADSAGTLLGLVNAVRASHGVASLAADPALTRAAQAWSVHMAATNSLSHNPNLASQIAGGWTKLGENVGAGGSVPVVFNAFVNSAFHFGNIVDPTYNLTGIGVAVGANGTLWITEDFEGTGGAVPAPATTAPTTTAPAPRPAAPKATTPPAVPTPTAATLATTPATTPAPTAPTAPPAAAATTVTAAVTTTTVAAPPRGTPKSGLGPPGNAGGLAADAAATSNPAPSGSIAGWVLALALLAIAALAAGTVFVRRLVPTDRPRLGGKKR